jgi:hypothetical protein
LNVFIDYITSNQPGTTMNLIARAATFRSILAASLIAISTCAAAQGAPSLDIVWPPEGAVVQLGSDAEAAVGVVVKSNFVLRPAGQCGDTPRCGHIHMKIDPAGDSCNIPGRPYNSMNSDTGGDLIKARFGHCPTATGVHEIGVLLADDRHKPVLVDGRPVVGVVKVTAVRSAHAH